MPEYLTDADIKVLAARAVADGVRFEKADAGEPGLRVRAFPSGTVVWFFWYRTKAGQARRYRLGAYPKMTLSAARKRAKHESTDVDRGGDPQGRLQQQRAERKGRQGAMKLSDLCDDFAADQKKRWRPATRAGWLRYIEADIKPGLGRRIPGEITTDDVLAFLEHLKRTRGAVSVARCYEVLRRIFRWAVARRKLPTSPCFGLDAGELLTRPEQRSRTYSDDEIRAILAASQQTELRHLVPLLFHTAARQEETRSAERRHVDVNARVWTIPAERSKTGEAHRVPLSSGALAVLDELPERGRLFPAATSEGYMDPPRYHVLKLRRLSGVADFRLHDVRRTVRQRLADMGVSAHVGEAVLGHLPPKIVRTYTPQWEPIREMAAALEAWSAELGRIVRSEERRGADVVPLVRA